MQLIDDGYALSGLAGQDDSYLEGLGLGGLKGYDEDVLQGVLSQARAAKRRWPSLSDQTVVQLSRRLAGLPVDRGAFDLSELNAYDTANLGTAAPTATTQLFVGTRITGVRSLRQGAVDAEQVGIAYYACVDIGLFTVDQTTGAISNTTTAGVTDAGGLLAQRNTWENVTAYVRHTEVRILQNGRPKWEGRLADCSHAGGLVLNQQSGNVPTVAATSILGRPSINGDRPQDRVKLPDPIILLPDLPVTVELTCRTALTFTSNVGLIFALKGELIRNGGVGR